MYKNKLAELLMSGIKENLIICGCMFQNMEQAEIDEVFKEIFLEIDSIYEHSDNISDFYDKVDKDNFRVFWSTRCIYFNLHYGGGFSYKIYFYSYPPKESIVSFLINL
jgi:hypothetical protein